MSWYRKHGVRGDTMEEKRLNSRQAAELERLIAFERDCCSADGMVVYQCAFPLRPQDALQAELVDRGMLEVKTSADSDRPFVVISAEGYSYVDRIEEEDRRERRLERRDWLIVLVSGLFGMLCTLIGLLIGLSM